MEYGKTVGDLELKRGQVWYISYNDAIGRETAAGRPMLIVSSDQGLETSPVITGLFLTTTPKYCGYAVEVHGTAKRSWVLCNQFVTADKRRLLKKMAELSEADMLKVELSLRNVLGLPLRNEAVESELVKKNEELQQCQSRIEELELELSVHTKLYEKVLDKLVSERVERDCAAKMAPVVEKPELKIEEPLDLSGLAEKFKVYDEREKISEEEVAATLEQAGMKKKAADGTRVFGGGRAKLAANAKPINVNTADLADFENIGLGTMTAKNIIVWRKKHGSFVSLEDMLQVPRFGKGCLRTFESVLEV